MVGGHQGVDREQPERRRAVDQDKVVVLLDVSDGLLERQLPAHLPAQAELRLGKA